MIKSREKFINNVNVPLDTFYKEEAIPDIREEKVKDYAISRAMAISKLFDKFNDGQTDVVTNAEYNDFFFDAVSWLNAQRDQDGNSHFMELYSRNEILKPITWCELGYLWYYVLGNRPTLSISALRPKVKVCVLKETDPNSSSKINHKLKDYKAGLSMTQYLEDIKEGRRYMPVCLCHSFECLVVEGWVNEGEFLKELTEKDLDKFLGQEGF